MATQMEENIKFKIKKNWRNIKDKLIGQHTKVRDLFFENGVLDDDDMDMVAGIVTPMDKIDLMMRKMLHRKEYLKFVNILEQNGYEQLCKEIKETASDSTTKPEDTNTASVLERIDNLEKLTEQSASREEIYVTKLNELKENIDDLKTENQHLKEQCNTLEKDYTHLKEGYQSARTKIEGLTLRLKAMNSENEELKGDLKSAQDKIEKLKENDSPQKAEMIRIQQIELVTLENRSAQQNEQIETLHQKTEEQNEKLKNKEYELKYLTLRIEELKRGTNTVGKGKRQLKTRSMRRSQRK